METNYEIGILFEQYSDMVYRIAISYGNNIQMAQDAVQEVFLRVLTKKPQFESAAHEKAWLIRVTVNYCKSMLSSAWIKRTCPLDDAEHGFPVFYHKEENELYEALIKLPAKYRIVLYLRYYEEYPVKEIARILHIMPNTVSARLGRAKKMLKQEIIKEMEDGWYEKSFVQIDVR